MCCPKCGGKTAVVYTYKENASVSRKRKCLSCGDFFFTSETISTSAQELFFTLDRRKRLERAKECWEKNTEV